MARYTGPSCRLCRREGCKLFLKGERCVGPKCAIERRPVVPGQHGLLRRKEKEHGIQLREKQKVKRAYGVLEKQFHAMYEEAVRRKGITGENLLSLLELRLDNVVYRMGIASSRAEARQIVAHRHITVNGKPINIASYSVKKGDVVAIKENKRALDMFKSLKGQKPVMPKWLEFSGDKLVGKILDLPKRDDIDLNIQEHLIIELYSK
ncbi:MAG: 30S ribosomal protein S4 [Firmicutes bacterium]|nr:30S ribosomal protein S4 [Bacillota bacterium]